MLTFYTNRFIPERFAGYTIGPVILIRPDKRGDVGLLRHEQTHQRQWVWTLGLHPLLYRFSRRYRLRAEVEAYQRQANWYIEDRRPLFAKYLAEKYKLDISEAVALELLRAQGEQ